MKIFTINLADIDVSDRLRAVDPVKVREMLPSWLEQGQMIPIEVRSADANGKYKLVSGGHRVAVAREAGHEEIFATIFDGGDDAARLREIDENLYRAELTAYDQAAFLAERRQIYERLHGRVKAGAKGARIRDKSVPSSGAAPVQLSFFDETTKKFGLQRKTIIRALSRYSRIDEKVWAALRGTKFCSKGNDLDAIGKLTPAVQWKVAQQLRTGAFSSVKAAIRSVVGAPEKANEPSIAKRIISLWARATAQDRQDVLDHLSETGALGG